MTSADGRKRELARLAVFVAAVTAVAVPVGFAGGDAYVRVDADWYLNIAQGRTGATMNPFAARQLGPLLVRGLTAVTHASVLHCFLWLGIISLLVVVTLCGWLLLRQGAGWTQLLAVGGMFFWSALFGSFMLPDTFSAALLSVFLLALWTQRYTLAICMLAPMFVARESTILVLACLLIAGWTRLTWLQRGLSVLSSFVGIFIVRLLTAHSLPNREQISPLLYMAGKIPWNFLSNVLALDPWTPTLTGFCAVPSWTMHLPAALQFGGSHLAGICGWQPIWYARLILLPLCSFGLLPLLSLFLLRYHRKQFWGTGLFRHFCIVYGVAAFILAPLLGRTMERLFLYSWPLFLLVTPIVAATALHGKAIPWKLLLTLHLATSWIDFLLFESWEQRSPSHAWGLFLAVVAVNVTAWLLLHRADLRPPRSTNSLETA